MSVRALTALAAVIAITVLTLPASATPRTLPIKAHKEARKTMAIAKKTKKVTAVQSAQLHKAAVQIGELRRLTWLCQDKLIASGALKKRTPAASSVWGLPQSVPYRVWVAKQWIKAGKNCQRTLNEHTLPLTNNWFVATTLADRVYPGTKAWLLSCSGGEGGHGGWVPNHQGSGASGWMQFMSGTYYGYSNAAFADARSKGFIIDSMANSWYHPLGQALTAAYMRHLGISHYHWDPRVDAACA